MEEHRKDEVDRVRRRLLLAGVKYSAPAIVALLFTQEAYGQSCMPPAGCMPESCPPRTPCGPGFCMPATCMP